MMIIIIYPSIHGPVELTTSNQNLLQREVVILHRSWLEDWSKRWAKVAKVKHSIRQKTWRENRVLHSSIHPFLFPAKPSQNLSHPSSCSLTEEEELKKHPLHSQLTSFIIMVAKEGTVGFGYWFGFYSPKRIKIWKVSKIKGPILSYYYCYFVAFSRKNLQTYRIPASRYVRMQPVTNNRILAFGKSRLLLFVFWDM